MSMKSTYSDIIDFYKQHNDTINRFLISISIFY